MPDHVRTTRGPVVESTHLVHAAITDSFNNLLFSVGNPTRTTLLRSAAKPAQSIAILEACNNHFAFSPADLALMSASHSSEPRHVARAQAMLDRAGAKESDMRCGGHAALSPAVNKAWIKAEFSPGPLCNNCSGKHAGMLAGARVLNGGFENYHDPDHPMQKLVRGVVQDLTGLGEEHVPWAVDGCNLPAPAVPLRNMATMYAKFASAADSDAEGGNGSQRERSMKRVFDAMCEHPEMVGGEKRFCTELMTAYDGLLIGKLGADGCYGVGIRESDVTRRNGVTSGGLGIAVKIEDGNIDILYAAVMEILHQLDLGTQEVRDGLQSWHKPEIFNTMGVVTGETAHCFTVRKEAGI